MFNQNVSKKIQIQITIDEIIIDFLILLKKKKI